MKYEPGYLIGMAIQSVPEPRKVARDILALRFSRTTLWQTFILFCVLSTGLGVIASILVPLDPEQVPAILTDPIRLGIIEASLLVMTIFAIYWVGHALGGKGRFDQAILTVVWIQFVTFMLQVILLALLLFAPLMAGLVQIFAVVVMFWILSHFIAEMHGFRSVGLVFVMIIITLMGVMFGLALIAALIGVSTGVAGAM